MTKSTATSIATPLIPAVLQVFSWLFLLYVINEILSKALGLGEKKK